MKVLVIIISYNFEPWMERCLNSLHQSEYPADVLVIDNGTKDQSIERLRKDYPKEPHFTFGTPLTESKLCFARWKCK